MTDVISLTVLRSAQGLPASPVSTQKIHPITWLCQAVEDLAIYIDNFVSKHIFEPLGKFWEDRQRSLEKETRKDTSRKDFKSWYMDLIKQVKNPSSGIETYGCVLSALRECRLDESFKKSSFFTVLQDVNPSYKKPEEWQRIKAIYEKSLQLGTCRGQSFVTLKLAPYFPIQGPLKETIQIEYQPVIAFIQLSTHIMNLS